MDTHYIADRMNASERLADKNDRPVKSLDTDLVDSTEETKRSLNLENISCGKRLEQSIINKMLSRFFCASEEETPSLTRKPCINTISLNGIECIGLGAAVDEQSPLERVHRSVTQLRSNVIGLISVGRLYSLDSFISKPSPSIEEPDKCNLSSSIGFDVKKYEDWTRDDMESFSEVVLPLDIGVAIEYLKKKDFDQAGHAFQEILENHRTRQTSESFHLEALTLHNIGVVYLLAGDFDKALLNFKEACRMKRINFGHEHPEVSVSLVESGIILFAMEKYKDSLDAFNDALQIRKNSYGSEALEVAWVLNNIACALFAMRNHVAALVAFEEARNIQYLALGVSKNIGLDLLHFATTLGNIGYAKLQAKCYEDAREVLEDALLVQQSVLGDDHKTVEDTLSNIDFSTAFHSWCYEDAREVLEDALLVQQSVLGDDHKTVEDTLSNIDFSNAFHS